MLHEVPRYELLSNDSDMVSARYENVMSIADFLISSLFHCLFFDCL